MRAERKKRGARFITGPAEAITKEEHDQRVSERGRPLTQDPIGWEKKRTGVME